MGVNMEFRVASESLDKPGDMYTFFLSDFPHDIKKIANALEMASKASSLRDLKIPAGFDLNGDPFFYPVNLKVLQNVWEKYNACETSGALQRERKLTYGHFVKNAFTSPCSFSLLPWSASSTPQPKMRRPRSKGSRPAFPTLACAPSARNSTASSTL